MSLYEYHNGLGVTACVGQLDDVGRYGWGIVPDALDDGKFHVLHVVDGVQSIVEMTYPQLNEYIADLQRALAGCFIGEWPRPFLVSDLAAYGDFSDYLVHDEPEQPQHDVTTVADMIEWLGTQDPDAGVKFRSLIDIVHENKEG